jgi:hypothetical protein
MEFLTWMITALLALFPSYGSGIQQISPFIVSGDVVRVASSTANFRIPSLTSLDCIGTDGDGIFREGTCTGGGGGGSGFSTTSNDYWKTVRNFFSTTSADYWETQQTRPDLAFSTTSADYWKTVRDFFSTTSANYWETQQVRTDFTFSTTSADYWQTVRNFFSTTSANYLAGLTRDWQVTNGALAPTTTRGILVSASSTIGGGMQMTGLTISGGATTTGNAFFNDIVRIGNLTIDSVVGGASIAGSDGGSFNVTDQVYTGALQASGNITPGLDATHLLGTPSLRWLRMNAAYASTTASSAGTFCLTGDSCITSWPTGGSGSTGTSTSWKSTLQGWFYPDGTDVFTDIAGQNFHTLKPIWYEVDPSGGDIGTLDLRTVALYGAYGYSHANATTTRESSVEQFVTVSGNDPEIHTLTASPSLSATAIAQLVAFATSTGFTGIELDWEGFGDWTAGESEDYVDFVRLLTSEAHRYGLKTMIYLPPIWNSCSNCESGSGDEWDSANSSSYYEIAYEDFEDVPVDYIVLPAYDYHFDYGAGRPNSPLKWQDEIINFAKSRITDHDRLILGIPAAGYGGATGGFSFAAYTYDDISAVTGFGGASRDTESGELTWTNGGNSYFISDSEALNIKRERAEANGIKRVTVWHIGGNQFPDGKFEPTLANDPETYTDIDIHGRTSGSILRMFTNAGVKILDALNTGVTTLLGTWDFSGAIVKQHEYPAWTWPGSATTTTSTTSVPLGQAMTSEQWAISTCRTTSGSSGYRYGDGSNWMNYISATSTRSRYALSTNNTFSTDEPRVVEVGPLTNAQITCGVDKIVNN